MSDKATTIQLQAAGLWACYKHTANQYVANGKVTIRDSMKSLYRNYDAPYNTYFQEADVEPLFEMYKRSGGTWELQDAEWYQKRSLGSGR